MRHVHKRVGRILLAPDDLGSGASTPPDKKDDPPKDAEKKDAKELEKSIAAVEKKIEAKKDEIAKASESTMHAVLEEIRELRKELAGLKTKRSRWTLF